MEADGRPDQASNPFANFLNLADVGSDTDECDEKGVSTLNPNQNDDRRLFQVYTTDLSWNPRIPYDLQPNRLEHNGPIPLMYPDHFLQVEGGVVVVYWERDRSTACICCIINVDEVNGTFTYRVYGYQGKSRKTFHDTGKDKIADKNEVWRMVHRTDFEREVELRDIQTGQTIRVMLEDKIHDITVFVKSRNGDIIECVYFSGPSEGESINFNICKVTSAVEIMSSPLFYRFRKHVSGAKSGRNNIVWKQTVWEEDLKMDEVETPRMLLSAPQDCKHKRV